MRIPCPIGLSFALVSVASVSCLIENAAQTRWDVQLGANKTSWSWKNGTWSTPLNSDTTSQFIFATVDSLLQRLPNTLNRNGTSHKQTLRAPCDNPRYGSLGHTLVPATIPVGTILYHGRHDDAPPVALDWLAFDFEHSYLFCREDCYVMSYMTTRPLQLVYLDGASASKLPDGPMDVQDIVIWGRPRPDNVFHAQERITAMCKWGARLGLDGFVRMEMHLYVSKPFAT
jgi:hypothetical protein